MGAAADDGSGRAGGEPVEPRIVNGVEDMRHAVFFDGLAARSKQSRFWLLLVLAAVIAAAGVVGDSTATVIGAMIVAPMMIPIQGSMLATVLGDRANLARSVWFVTLGAAVVVAIGFLTGLLDPVPVTAATNSQVASRVTPGLVDLLAALGTGVVGSVALVRKDISDTLPGVAIAISLVPPLSVVGLTLESGVPLQSLGALLLFVTNVTAIVATGLVVLGLERIRVAVGATAGRGVERRRNRRAVAIVAAMGIVVLVPLVWSSVGVVVRADRASALQRVGTEWGGQHGWRVVSVDVGTTGRDVVVFTGAPPVPETASLTDDLRGAGVSPSGVTVRFVPQVTRDLGASDPDLTHSGWGDASGARDTMSPDEGKPAA